MTWYFLNSDNNYTTDGAWSDTDGGTPVSGFPVTGSTEDVFFTANSGDCLIDAANTSVKSLNCTGYTGTITTDNVIFSAYESVILNPLMHMNVIVGSLLYAGLRLNNSPIGQTIITNGFVIPYLQVQNVAGGTGMLTLLDTLVCDIMQPVSAAVTFLGSFGWTTKKFISPATGSASSKIILTPGNIYKITELYEDKNQGSVHREMKSVTSGTKATLTVTGEASIAYVDFTDIDASGGRPIYTWNGVVTNCININTFNDIVVSSDRTVASSKIM